MSNVDPTWLATRHRAERRFRRYGMLGIGIAVLALTVLLGSIILQGTTGFFRTEIRLAVTLDPAQVKNESYRTLARDALYARFAEAASDRQGKRALLGLLSSGAGLSVARYVADHPQAVGTTVPLWLTASDDVDMAIKGRVDRETPEALRNLNDRQFAWLDALQAEGAVRQVFHWRFFAEGDSREPELAGMGGSIIGSLLTIVICLAVAFPLGVMTAVYLEEFAPRSRFVEFITVNINNLAAVPSIIFGLLGLAVFLQFFELPRSAALVGGLTLSLMILPTLIISTRAAIEAVPPSIRDAARGLGASPLQVVLHHVLPLAMPGIMTGTILGTARALGETAPLLMIGMVAFVADIPGGFTDPATTMPVQTYLWADSPEAGFREKTASAILVLLSILIALNALAIYLRKKYEHRWD